MANQVAAEQEVRFRQACVRRFGDPWRRIGHSFADCESKESISMPTP
jgi:hypothetical protein